MLRTGEGASNAVSVKMRATVSVQLVAGEGVVDPEGEDSFAELAGAVPRVSLCFQTDGVGEFQHGVPCLFQTSFNCWHRLPPQYTWTKRRR